MDSDEVYEMLRVIEHESSTKNKIALLAEFLNDPLFDRVILLAYHHHENFGVLDMPLRHGTYGVFVHRTFVLLSDLANRNLTGHAARYAIAGELLKLSEESARLFLAILNKDLRAGFSVKSINKARPGTVPQIPYMRCSLPKDINKDDFKGAIFSQEKMDGLFVNVTVTDSGALFTTRVGYPFDSTALGDVAVEAYERLENDTQTHGELLVYNVNTGKALDRKTSNGMLNHVMKSREPVKDGYEIRLIAWDIVPTKVISGEIDSTIPYHQRLDHLADQLYEGTLCSLVNTRKCLDEADIAEHYLSIRVEGGEGTIVKTPSGLWKNGTSRQQYKLKAERVCELAIFDFERGKPTGKYRNTLGAVMCRSSDGLLEVSVSGFTDQERDEIWTNKDAWIHTIIGVRFNEVVSSKNSDKLSLFLPRFIEKRSDKLFADELPYIQSL